MLIDKRDAFYIHLCTLFFVTFWGKNNTELNSVLKTGFYARVGHFLIRILQIWIYTIIIILRTVQNGPVRSSHRQRTPGGEKWRILSNFGIGFG